MQVVDHLGEDIRRLLIAGLIQNEETDRPFSHGKLLNRRRLVAVQLSQQNGAPDGPDG